MADEREDDEWLPGCAVPVFSVFVAALCVVGIYGLWIR